MQQSLKQVIVVRTDLDLPKGKLCSQVAHAALLAALKVKEASPKKMGEWLSQGGRKIVLKVGSEGKLDAVYQNARERGLPAYRVKDKGLTVVKPGTVTCVGIGPASSDKIDAVTGDLKLL